MLSLEYHFKISSLELGYALGRIQDFVKGGSVWLKSGQIWAFHEKPCHFEEIWPSRVVLPNPLDSPVMLGGSEGQGLVACSPSFSRLKPRRAASFWSISANSSTGSDVDAEEETPDTSRWWGEEGGGLPTTAAATASQNKHMQKTTVSCYKQLLV